MTQPAPRQAEDLTGGPSAPPRPPLILASASPRRSQLLESLGLDFEVYPAQVIEREEDLPDPREMVLHNAALKADWVARRRPEAVVLGADTTVFIDGQILNKPANLEEARSMLKRLSGRTHTVFTGISVRWMAGNFSHDEGVTSEVEFKPLDDNAINEYFDLVNPLDKAGAYGIQEGRELIIAAYRGSLTNVMGLPIEETRLALTRCGILDSLPPAKA